MAILAVSQFTAQHATKFHSFGYSSARVSGTVFDVRNGPDLADQVFQVDYTGLLTLGVPLPLSAGGIEITTMPQGSLLYASALDTPAALPIGAANATLTSDGTVPGWTAGLTNTHIAVGAEISVSKLADGGARQLLQTDAGGTIVEWTSDIDIPGTLDVTSAAVFDNTVTVVGLATMVGGLELKDGVNPVEQHIYGTFTDASNYERLSMRYQAGGGLFGEDFYMIESQRAGTGVTRGMQIGGTPGAGDDLYLIGYVYGEFTINAQEGFGSVHTTTGDHTVLAGTNTSTAAGANTRIFIQTAGSNGGDPYFTFISNTTKVFAHGIDQTTGNYRLYPDTGPDVRPRDSSNGMTMDPSGNVTFINGLGAGVVPLSTTFLHLGAATTGKSSIVLPHGTAPSSPNNGDVWTTTSGFFARISGATVGPFTSNAGDITRVNIIAGTGLVGDVDTTSGDHTQTIDAIGTSNRISVSSGAIDISSSYVGQATITTIGTLASGAVPASLVTAGSFGSGTFTFDGTVNATTFVGALTGDASGNAGTATILQTTRTINGTGFNGSTNITITAAAGTLTGGTLNATVLTSSLTTVGEQISFRATEAGVGVGTSGSTYLNLADGTTGKSSLRIGHGVAPTSPANGDVWTTSAEGFFVRINGVTVGPLGTSGTGDITRVNITAGIGLLGDVDTTTGDHTQTLDFDATSLTVLGSGLVAGDHIVVSDGTVSKKALVSGIDLGIFNNDQNWSSTVGTVTNVATGTGLAGTITNTGTITLSLNSLSEKTGDLVGSDRLVGLTGSTHWAETISGIPLSIFSNSVSGFTSNVGTVTNVTGGTGLDSTEGATPDITLNLNELATGGTPVGGDFFVYVDGTASRKIAINLVPLGAFSNSEGWTSNAGDITGVNITAGNGLTGNVNTGSGQHTQTINAVGTSNRIQVNSGNIDIHSSYVGQTSITTLGTITTGTIPAARVQAGTLGSGAFTVNGNLQILGQAYSPQQTTGSGTINWDLGNSVHLDNSGSRTISLSGGVNGGTYIISIQRQANAVTSWTWPTIQWVGGSAPTLSTASGSWDLIYLMRADGVWIGNYSLGHT